MELIEDRVKDVQNQFSLFRTLSTLRTHKVGQCVDSRISWNSYKFVHV